MEGSCQEYYELAEQKVRTVNGHRIPMATTNLNAKKAASRAAGAHSKAVLHRRQIQGAVNLLKQVSDPTRLLVVSLLSEREWNVGGLCDELTQTQPAMSYHLTLLRLGGIINRRRQGKKNFYSLTSTGERLSRIVMGIPISERR